MNVTGSWCPNCHDEAPFLASLHKRFRDRGFEVVALDFEEEEQIGDLARLKAFVTNYGIEYPYLVGGQPNEVLARLPQVRNLNTWPATFFVGRDGTVRAIRTGFASKATGELYATLVQEYTSIIEGLLSEPVPPPRVIAADPDAPADTTVARVHASVLTIDPHIDLRGDFNTKASNPSLETDGQFDLPKLQRGELDVATVALFAESRRRTPENRAVSRAQFEAKRAAITKFVESQSNRLTFVKSSDDIAAAQRDRKQAILLSALNTMALEPDTSELVTLHAAGVRIFGFAHVGDNDFAHSSRPSVPFGDTVAARGGLTELGQRSVATLNRLGMVIDVSQLTPAGVFDVLRLSRTPVIASHSGLRSRVNATRNLTIDEAKAIADRGGVVHIVAFGPYLRANPHYDADYKAQVWEPFGLVAGRDDPTVKLDSTSLRKYGEAYRAFSRNGYTYWTLDDYLDAVDAAVRLLGIDHVGLSSDFNHGGGVSGFADVGDAPNVTRGLLRRGYSEVNIAKLWGGNFLRVLRKVEAVGRGPRKGRTAAVPPR